MPTTMAAPVSTSASSTIPYKAISVELVERAVKALLKWKATNSKDQKPQLLSSDEFLYLVVTLKKIPQTGRTNPHRIPLTHPLHTTASDGSSGTELCLFIDDRPKRRPTSKDAKAKIEADKVPISQVVKFSKLKSDYKAFEDKRKLCDSYELFLADRRIMPLMPKALGKHFYKKKKIPIAVDLWQQNWKEQVERICGSAFLFLKTGTCSSVMVARGSMEKKKIVENVMAAINGVAETVPRKWKNIRSLHLKFSESLALPVYQSMPETNLKIPGLGMSEGPVEKKKKRARGEDEDGEKEKKNVAKKGKIREVRYMDGASESDGEEGGDLFEEEMSDEDDAAADGDKISSRRRELEEVGRKEKKVAKESAKVRNENNVKQKKPTNRGNKAKAEKLKG